MRKMGIKAAQLRSAAKATTVKVGTVKTAKASAPPKAAAKSRARSPAKRVRVKSRRSSRAR